MDKKNGVKTPPGDSKRTSLSQGNRLGAARRRLMRAILASGGVVPGALLTARWQKPIIDTVVLPVHARTSLTGCGVTLAFSLESLANSSAYDYAVSIYVRSGISGPSTLLGSVSTVGPLATGVTGSTSLAPGTYLGEFSYSATTTFFGAIPVYGATCCTQSWSEMGSGVNTPSNSAEVDIIAGDDGSCTVIPAKRF